MSSILAAGAKHAERRAFLHPRQNELTSASESEAESGSEHWPAASVLEALQGGANSCCGCQEADSFKLSASFGYYVPAFFEYWQIAL